MGAAAFLALLVILFFAKTLIPPTGQALGGYDLRGYYALVPETIRHALAARQLPLWDPYRYNGMPFLADPQTMLFYPPAWLMLLLPVNVGLSWFMAFHVWLAALGMFVFVRGIGGRRAAALLAGLAFAFGGYLTGRLWAGHTAVYAVSAWTPWMLLAFRWAVQQGDWRSAVMAGLPFGLSILAGHYPSFLYVGLIWGAYGIFLWHTNGHSDKRDFSPPRWEGHEELPKSQSEPDTPAITGGNSSYFHKIASFLRGLGALAVPFFLGKRFRVLRQGGMMALVGLGLAAASWLPFVQFSLATERVAAADYNFATDYSLPPAHLITLLVPEFFGEPTRLGYWSVPTFEELTYYAGIVAVLGLLVALRRPSRFTIFALLLMVVGLWLALGRYGILYQLAFDWLPPFRLVRAPARAAFLWSFAVSALMGIALSQRPDGVEKEQLWRWLRGVLVVGGVVGAAAISAAGAAFMAVHPTETSGRLWHQINGYALALALFISGGILIWHYTAAPSITLHVSRFTHHISRYWPAIALILLSLADLWGFSRKMARLELLAPHPLWSEAQAMIGPTTQRVLPWGLAVFDQNGSLTVGLTSMFGYDALEPADHLALATSVADPRSSAYDVLAVSYVLSPTPLDQFTGDPAPLSLFEQRGGTWVYTRPRALPVARLVYEVEVIEENAAAIHQVHQPDFQAAQTGIVAADPPCTLRPGTGTATVVETRPGYWRIETQSDSPALLILAETAYPGWQVWVDGEKQSWQKAYTTLRATCVPAGEHTVEWQFRPGIFWVGVMVSLLAGGVVAAASWSWWPRPRCSLSEVMPHF